MILIKFLMIPIFVPEKISLSRHPVITEHILQDKIAENPKILGLGDLVLKDKERIQTGAGRLDLLFQDIDTDRRYEVEIQLGRTDESHIIRTIEYWDTERRRYPQYDHCAVIIAEDITTRFHNVINLFNGSIPLIAIQINAYQFRDEIGLVFTTVLDEMTRGLDEEGEEASVPADRNYWIGKGSDATVKMADRVLDIINEFSGNYQYTRHYIGLVKGDHVNNFVIMRPRRSTLNLDIKAPFSEEMQKKIDENGFSDIGYHRTWGRFRVRLSQIDISDKKEIVKELLVHSYQNSQ